MIRASLKRSASTECQVFLCYSPSIIHLQPPDLCAVPALVCLVTFSRVKNLPHLSLSQEGVKKFFIWQWELLNMRKHSLGPVSDAFAYMAVMKWCTEGGGVTNSKKVCVWEALTVCSGDVCTLVISMCNWDGFYFLSCEPGVNPHWPVFLTRLSLPIIYHHLQLKYALRRKVIHGSSVTCYNNQTAILLPHTLFATHQEVMHSK